tara:strand:+ start:297 stop:644 length:348 start_codon:yes stop_codon:yes gene_type:complete
MKVIIDTNSLIYSIENKIDIFDFFDNKGFEIIILNCVIEEIKKINAKKFKLISEIISNKNLKIEKNVEGHTDDIIIELAKKNKYAILTNDKALKNKATKEKIILYTVGKSSVKKI